MDFEKEGDRIRGFAFLFILMLFMMALCSVQALASVGQDDFEPDNSQAQAKVIFRNTEQGRDHNFHTAEDEDWVTFNAVEGEYYEIRAQRTGERSSAGLELYSAGGTEPLAPPECLDDTKGEVLLRYTFEAAGQYYVRVKQCEPDHFGEGSDYTLGLRMPYAGPARIYGFIVDGSSKKPVEGVWFKLQSSEGITVDINRPSGLNGEYDIDFVAGSYKLLGDRAGYRALAGNVRFPDAGCRPYDFRMVPKNPADLRALEISGPPLAGRGKTGVVNMTVANPAKSLAGRFKVKVYLSEDKLIEDAKDRSIKTFTINGLAANERMETTRRVLFPRDLAPGEYYIGFKVDSDWEIVELKEGNNIKVSKSTIEVK